MKASPLLVTSQQPLWLRFILTVAVALVSIAFTSRQYQFITWFAFFVGYIVLTGIPWLIVRSLPPQHSVRALQARHDDLSRRFWSYRYRDQFWLGFGLLVALFAAHGPPDQQHCGPYIFGASFSVIGIVAAFYWHSKHHELESTGNT
jgi:hypothetical protein